MKSSYLRLSNPYLLFSLVVIIIAACAVNPITGKKEVSFMSEEKEIALGKQYDPIIVQQYGLYSDEKLQAFIDEKGQEMAAISHRPHLDFEFKIMNTSVVNAFAVPGGYVYFTRGIMAHFNNEAEFAGVLGHEIGHVTARHAADQQTKQTLGQIALIGGMIASPEFREFGDVASQSLGLLFLKFSRQNESESDDLGVQYSTRVGYDSHQMAEFFQTLNRLSGGAENRLPEFASTHPDPINRFNDVHRLTEAEQTKYDKKDYTIGRDSYLRMIDNLVYGEDPREGYVENWKFYHPELKFLFPVPQSWKYVNSPTTFQMAPENGEAMMALTIAQGATLAEAHSAFQQQYQTKTISQNSTTINGLPALVVVSELEQQNQQTGEVTVLKMKHTYIDYNGLKYSIMGLSLQKDFNKYASSFDKTMKGFKKLTDPSKINVTPERLKIVTATNERTLKDGLMKYSIPVTRHQEFAILNGMELTDVLEKGMLYKVIKK